jgi:glycosyltransferase involved in cell wall biosynthesis
MNRHIILPENKSLALFSQPNFTILHNNNFTKKNISAKVFKEQVPEVLFITSYPPRECGIATYSIDLMNAINVKFKKSFTLKVCALETSNETFKYNHEVNYVINTSVKEEYIELAQKINQNKAIELIVIEHEFGFFVSQQQSFIDFLCLVKKPILITFHTVLPLPSKSLKTYVQQILTHCHQVIVMTNHSAKILVNEYQISAFKINVIPHGTHLVPHLDKLVLKEKYNLEGRKVFSTFGLISEGKNIETTLNAMPQVILKNPDALFLVIGKTHPIVKKEQGEVYRECLEQKVIDLGLENHVLFINEYLPLPTLLDYLQLTDVYLFTSKDRHQAVSGTFSYAVSCGCPIVSTPIPHACEVLDNKAGIIIDFEDSIQLSQALNLLLKNNELREEMTLNGLHSISSTAWENTAIAHALLFDEIIGNSIPLKYSLPGINLNHINKLTTESGMVQFSKINVPDLNTGYTLDDNARALIAMCMHFENSNDDNDLEKILIYFHFIKYCFQINGYFLNYVDVQGNFTEQNYETNLADSNGRAIWALGYLISQNNLPVSLINDAKLLFSASISQAENVHSTRSMAFIIKGLYYYSKSVDNLKNEKLVELLANRLVQMYKHESSNKWRWFESYLTYGNSILPEALLMAFDVTKNHIYKEIAIEAFDFLLFNTFNSKGIKVISNRSWLQKGSIAAAYGEQPIDIAYTIFALQLFYKNTLNVEYLTKIEIAFNWFLGQNHLHQVIYNPCTGGCYDGLEEHSVNLNQGAESTVSYLMARMVIEKYFPNYLKVDQPVFGLTENFELV